ncbi:MAG: hypothetical protein AAF806_09130 [Bacteroidota bacterium]
MFDDLVSLVQESVSQIADYRTGEIKYSLSDCIMSGFAMFSLKDPSLLSFMDNYAARRENLEQIYKIQDVFYLSRVHNLYCKNATPAWNP